MSESTLSLPAVSTQGHAAVPVNQIIHADCVAVLPTLPSASIDFVLTDPPYLANYADRDGRTVINDDNASWLEPAFAGIYRVLKPDRFCVSFYGWPKVDRFFGAWRRAGFHPVAHLIWTKDYASRQRFVGYHHEQAYLLAKGSPAAPAVPMRDVLRWEYTENRFHPTQKPVSGLAPLIRAFSRENDLVLDPFCGSGSTLIAAHHLGRHYLGIELDAAHCKTSEARLASRGFMLDLDSWTEANIIGQLQAARGSKKEWEQASRLVKASIRGKVLNSFRNGRQQARSGRS
jgi:site-specific DNA-methyltransferase (adenine-specific)